MKKPLRILFLSLLAVMLAFTAFGCNGNAKDGDEEKGLILKKTRTETNYTVTKYIDDGKTVGSDGVLDIGAVAEDLGVTVNKIKSNAFKGNDTIKKLIVPSSVEEIEKGAFAGMKALEEIVLPFIGANDTGDGFINQTPNAENKAVDAKRSFGYLFGATEYDEGMTETFKFGAGTSDTISCYIPYTLEKITVNPSGLYTLPMYAFAGLTGVKEIELGNQVSYIGNYAFTESDVEIVNIPNNVEVIGEGAFSFCSGLKEIEFGDMSLLTTIGDSAFRATKIEKFELPDYVSYVGNYAFASSFTSGTEIKADNESMVKEIVLPSTLRVIGMGAFFLCGNLETVTLKTTDLTLGNYAFAYCAKLDTTELESDCTYNHNGKVFVKAN